ncbi:hypothetical protein JVU11DRAFT_1974 [Chiua virens]|nr:hypothetical protein JVU11DRAFT_1974 [Chiua virens]
MSTSSLAFVPRIVTKHAKPWHGIPTLSPSPPPDPTTDSELEQDEYNDDDEGGALPSSDKGKGKEKAIESAPSKHSTLHQDIASLISLALSDYNIWLDADLRQKLDACLTDDTASDDAGFVPINYLLRRSPFRGSFPLTSGQPDPSEAEVVKALRTHASHVFEVRMRLPSFTSPSSIWYGTGKTSRKKDVGGYEVRRKDWSMSHGWTRARWDALTIYMEGIPPQYRTIGGIARLAETLLSTCSKSETDTGTRPCFRVQNVTLPPHYLDKPGDMQKCKGYALITLSTKSHHETILDAWPWKRRSIPASEDADENVSPAVKDAFKYGLRILSKARWNALNEEYLLHKQSLVDEMTRTQPSVVHPDDIEVEVVHKDDPREPTPPSHPPPQAQMRTAASSPYPFDCLVFVRHVHPETNKTTLKSLFSRASQEGSGTGLDYVDFTKGMDTCYLRVAAPPHATRLITSFGTHGVVQADGLDAVGRTPVRDEKPIAMELIQGKKEELYWEKVPEKVRRQAVDKAIKEQLTAGTESSAMLSESTQHNRAHGTGWKKRKRDS